MDELFRGININTKLIVYGDLIHKEGKVYIGYWEKDDISPCPGYIECQVYPQSIQKYSGILDIQERKVFQGDSVRVKWTKASEYFIEDKVAFKSGCFILKKNQSILSNFLYIEVIEKPNNKKCA